MPTLKVTAGYVAPQSYFIGTVESDDTVNTYKAFVWDKLQGLSPIADAVFGIVEK